MTAEVGAAAPQFSLLNQSRETVSLQGLKGKKVVLAFFPAAFTGVCTTEMCTFQDNLAKLNGLNATVLGVSVDSPFSNGAFASHNGIEFDILSDYQREVVNAFGVAYDDFAGMTGYTAAVRSVFVINADGGVTYKWLADNPGMEPNYDEVTAAVEAA